MRALALAGCVWPFGIAHLVTLDALLTFWLAVALGAFLLAQHWRADPAAATALDARRVGRDGRRRHDQGPRRARHSVRARSSSIRWLTRDRAPWRRLALHAGASLLLLLLAAPWFVLVSSRNPEFARFFFIHEHFERFLTTEHRRTGAWWYFLPMLALGLLPWTGVFLWGTAPQLARRRSRRRAFAWTRFCLIWSAFVFVFFSMSGSKLPSYILPIFPAAALVLGVQLERMPAAHARAVRRRRLRCQRCAVARQRARLDARSPPCSPTARTPRELFASARPLGQARPRRRRGRLRARMRRRSRSGSERGERAGIAALALATMLMMQAIYSGSDVFRATRSAADLVTTLENAPILRTIAPRPSSRFACTTRRCPFYLERTTTLVEYRDELGPGLDAEPGLGIDHEADWIARWQVAAAGLCADGARHRTPSSSRPAFRCA